MVVERLARKEEETYVWAFVDDALQSLGFCRRDEVMESREGMCTLGAFVRSQGYARSDANGDFTKCFR